MNKVKILHTIELISFIGVLLTTVIFIGHCIYIGINYSPAISLPMGASFFLLGIVYLIPLLFFLLVFLVVKRTKKKQGIDKLIQRNQFKLSKGSLKRISLIVLVLCIIGLIGAITFQEEFLYFPGSNEFHENSLNRFNDIEEVTISDSNNHFVGYERIIDATKPIIIFFGGNAQISSSTLYFYEVHDWYDFDEYNFIMIDYPTYGNSTGKLAETQIKDVGLLTYDYVVSELEYKSEDIILMGFSLGTGVASYVASKREASKLVLLAPYTSMIDVINTRLPIFYGPLKNAVRHQYNTINIIDEIDEETLIICSKDDDVINFDISNNLIASMSPNETLIVSGLRHNDILSDTAVNQKISEFISK